MNIEDLKNFEDWKKEYGLVYEPNYSLHTEMDCLAAFKAGQQSKQEDFDKLERALNYMLEQLDHTYRASGEAIEIQVKKILNE